MVAEYPLNLRVNGNELATLIASPHDLNFLVTGFLFNQGFVKKLDDILALGTCQDFGVAEVRLSTMVPERLTPILTTGCGSGISFRHTIKPRRIVCNIQRTYSFDKLYFLMTCLSKKAEMYLAHGGIHSAAIADENTLLLYAEDIGRHNTIDRLAGQALFQGIDCRNKILLTSGRISSEMVLKAIHLGIDLLVSRTSVTDQAINLCEQSGITLIGYLRSKSMEIYSHPERLTDKAEKKISGVSGLILAGGNSIRIGSDKSLLPLNGARLIDHVYSKMSEIFEEVIIATNSEDLYNEIPCKKVSDVYDGLGPLAGIHSGLKHASNDRVFVVACDMPFISSKVVRKICSRIGSGDVLLPFSNCGHEPLHALYEKSCLPVIENVLDMGETRISSIFDKVRVNEISFQDLSNETLDEKSFLNINSPEDYFRLRNMNTCKK